MHVERCARAGPGLLLGGLAVHTSVPPLVAVNDFLCFVKLYVM